MSRLSRHQTSSVTTTILLLAAGSISFALAPVACGSNETQNNNDGGATSNSSTGEGGAGSGQGGQGGKPSVTVSSSSSGDSSSSSVVSSSSASSSSSGDLCLPSCSPDLQQVLDCNGNVILTCPAGQGCAPNGTCIEACAAADANTSTLGCEFYAVQPSALSLWRGGCYAALVANTWDAPITLQIDYNGQALDPNQIARIPSGSGMSLTYDPLPNGKLDPGKIAIIFLAQASAGIPMCPSAAGITADTSVVGTGLAKAFHIKTTAPAVAYDMYPYGGAPSYVASATQLIPIPAWGTNYIAADAYEQDPQIMDASASPFVQIVAAEDNTQVTISPTKAIVGGPNVPPAGQGQPKTYAVNKGQVLQFFQAEELAGSPISSDKPIGIWGGTGCMNVPLGYATCDCGHQQILPVKSLGSEYAAVRYRDRDVNSNEKVPWTITGAVDGTVLTYDPAPPMGAPTTLANGQVVRFSTSSVFTVKSQDVMHPFFLAGHMTGRANTPTGRLGDPEFVISVPPALYLKRYLFLTDPTYGNTHLVFVRQKAKDGLFKPVTLDCVGEVTQWQPIGMSGQYEYAYVDLVVGGMAQGTCDNGVHTADSAAPFGLTVWGWDFAVSYAFPAGMSIRPINDVIVPPVP